MTWVGSRTTVAILAIAATLTCVGCSSQTGDQPALGRVRGRVTMNGKPLAGVDVVFSPESGRPSMATTDSRGRYDLTYVNTTRGAKVGAHRVSISPKEPAADETPAATSSSGTAATKELAIPPRYNARSELKAQVKPGRNWIEFPLTSK